jgi:LuxR family maltose regulon positive regulatory protein
MRICSAKAKSTYLLAWSYYLKAMTQLNLFKLDEAATQFSEVKKNRYGVDPRALLDAMAGLALVKQLNNDPVAARNEIHELVNFSSALNDPQIQSVAQSAAARVALLQGRLGEALEWETTFNEPVIFSGLFFWLESPWITKAKILIAEGSNRNLEKAEKLLLELKEEVENSNLQYHQVEVNMLLAIVFDRVDKKDEADDLMKMTVNTAKNFYCIRPFIEMGKYVTDLLNCLKEQQVEPDFIDIILGKLKQSESLAGENAHPALSLPQNISEKLSRREFEVIKYVADGFINKEIAQRLFISEVTIKKHLYNVFQKLGVKNRMAMVQKVKDMGMIQ